MDNILVLPARGQIVCAKNYGVAVAAWARERAPVTGEFCAWEWRRAASIRIEPADWLSLACPGSGGFLDCRRRPRCCCCCCIEWTIYVWVHLCSAAISSRPFLRISNRPDSRRMPTRPVSAQVRPHTSPGAPSRGATRSGPLRRASKSLAQSRSGPLSADTWRRSRDWTKIWAPSRRDRCRERSRRPRAC